MSTPINNTPVQTPAPAPLSYGSISYDVPDHMRKQYQSLRKLFKRRAIMQTMSAYLFPWSMAQEIENGLTAINTHDGSLRPLHDQVRFSMFKYDEEVSGKALAESAKESLRKTMSRTKTLIFEKLQKLQEEQVIDEDEIKSVRVACRKADNTLQDMQALALLFNLTDDMDVAFVAYAAWVESQREKLNAIEAELDRVNLEKAQAEAKALAEAEAAKKAETSSVQVVEEVTPTPPPAVTV